MPLVRGFNHAPTTWVGVAAWKAACGRIAAEPTDESAATPVRRLAALIPPLIIAAPKAIFYRERTHTQCGGRVAMRRALVCPTLLRLFLRGSLLPSGATGKRE